MHHILFYAGHCSPENYTPIHDVVPRAVSIADAIEAIN
jgi:hypothetical protein